MTQQARAASWSDSPAQLFSLCADIEKLNYPKPLAIANAYGHAAIAAARQNERTQFIKAMLYTENTLAPVQIYDHPNYLYAVRLAEANILRRRWRSAIIVANNIPDPNIKASILFRVMNDAPQELRLLNLSELFQLYSDQTWASPACAAHTEHRVRSGENLISIAEWSQKLPRASLRAAAFAGFARSAGTNTSAGDLHKTQSLVSSIDVHDSTSLLDAAERVANQIQDPIESAFVWLEIAKAWNLLGKTQRYRLAVTNLDDRLFDEWTAVWEQRPECLKKPCHVPTSRCRF